MRNNLMMAGGQRRIFRVAVWFGRVIGWLLLFVAILGVAGAELLPAIEGHFTLLPSVALGLMAVVWIVGLELFLHFFDRYLSRN